MTSALLNPNQGRRVSTHLRLLLEDLDEIAAWPELSRGGEPYDSIRAGVASIRGEVAALRAALDLPSDTPPPLRRRVMATAEVWAIGMEDLQSRHLKAYGRLHPDLGRVLDPALAELTRHLRRLANLASQLPDA
jgi:hypothetical protein